MEQRSTINDAFDVGHGCCACATRERGAPKSVKLEDSPGSSQSSLQETSGRMSEAIPGIGNRRAEIDQDNCAMKQSKS